MSLGGGRERSGGKGGRAKRAPCLSVGVLRLRWSPRLLRPTKARSRSGGGWTAEVGGRAAKDWVAGKAGSPSVWRAWSAKSGSFRAFCRGRVRSGGVLPRQNRSAVVCRGRLSPALVLPRQIQVRRCSAATDSGPAVVCRGRLSPAVFCRGRIGPAVFCRGRVGSGGGLPRQNRWQAGSRHADGRLVGRRPNPSLLYDRPPSPAAAGSPPRGRRAKRRSSEATRSLEATHPDTHREGASLSRRGVSRRGSSAASEL